VYNEIYTMLGRPTATTQQVFADARKHAAATPVMNDALNRFDEFGRVIQRSAISLSIFELWNLFAIVTSLWGFLFVPKLAYCWYASVGISHIRRYS
jgi:hypothetical protein